MERVGLCGFKGSGKDTIADNLVKNNGFINIILLIQLKIFQKFYLIYLKNN